MSVPIITSTPGFYLTGPIQANIYADEAFNSARGYIASLSTVAGGLAPPTINPIFPAAVSAPAQIIADPPATTQILWTAPAPPADFTGELDVSDLFFETFDKDAPELTFPSAPEFSEVAPDAPGVDTSFTMPDLVVNLPAKPSLLSINVRPFDGVTFPDFDAEAPVFDLVAPSIREYVPGAQYTSSLLTATKAALEDRIVNGGTGLGQDAETAIWDRGREREFRSGADALLDLEKMEAGGFMLPTGAYLDARLKISTEIDYASRGHSREVMVESARLELDQVKHALTTASSLEAQCMDYSNKVEQRLFDSSRYATEAGVSIYNAGVQAFSARMDGYKALVQAYVARIQAETAKVDAYKAEVDAENAKAQVNRALVDQYRAEIDAALSAVTVFKARVEAIQARADLERTKIMIYGEQVKAYGTKVNAYSAGIEAFRARIGAEQSKQEAYKSQVQAFTAQVDAQAKIIDARIATYRGQLEAYTARWEGFKAQASAEASRVGALASIDSTKADIYRAQVQGNTSYNEVLTKQWQANIEQSARISEIGVSAAKANAELYITTRSLALDAAKVGAQVSAQLAASSLSVLNFSASYSESRSDSGSNSYGESRSDSVSISNSTSTGTNTNYNYSV